MAEKFQRLDGAGFHAKLKMWNFYVLLVICGFTGDIYCIDAVNEKPMEEQTTSTTSSNVDDSDANAYFKDSSLEEYSNTNSYMNSLNRYSRAMPRVPTTSESSSRSKSKSGRRPDYVLKIPLSVLRMQDLYRILRLQEHTEDEIYRKRQTVIPVPRFGRSEYRNEDGYDDTQFSYPRSELDKFSEIYFQGLPDTEIIDETIPRLRNKRSMLLLTAPKSEESTKQKPSKTFIVPYPRPGRTNRYKIGKTNKDEIVSYDRSKQNKEQDAANFEGWLTDINSNSHSMKLDGNTVNENEDNSFFVIPYPRPGKKSIIKSKNGNPVSKNAEKEITDYVLPYPRPGKKSGKENLPKFDSYKNTGTHNIDSNNLMLPYPRPGRANKDSFFILDTSDIYTDSNEFLKTLIDFDSLGNDSEDNLRFKRSAFVVPQPRLGRSNSVVPYPRLGRSNSVIPHLRFGRSVSSSSEISNERLGRSNSIVPYPRFGRSESVLPYPRPGRSNSLVPYPRPGRADSLVPYPRPGRSDSLVPYPRPGRSNSLVPYPRPGRSDSLVPYPRPGRSNSLVPYPRPGRSDSLVPYPRPGRENSVVPYPRPGRSKSLIPYPRPGRSESLNPHLVFKRSTIGKPILPTKYETSENWLLPNLRPGRSQQIKEEDYLSPYIQLENFEDEDNSGYSDPKVNSENEYMLYNRYGRTTLNQGYVLPHPRIGRSLQERIERESMDTDTVIPYPRLGRSQKETIPNKPSSAIENSVHKLNKHMLPNVEDSVYILPYPRPGRFSE